MGKEIKMPELSGPAANGTMSVKEKIAEAGGMNENNPKAAEWEEKLHDLQEKLAKKKYRIKTTEQTFKWFVSDFYENVSWEGYECYAISETHKEFSKIAEKLKPSKTGKVSFTVKSEILEATFHFIKKHSGKGLTSASRHRAICEDFSVTMAEMNEDRAKLRDYAMEAEAAKHGITVEDYKKAADAMHAQQGAPQNMR